MPPSVGNFTVQASTNNSLEYTYSWSVNNADNNTLSCTLTTGDGSVDITISDCANNTT